MDLGLLLTCLILGLFSLLNPLFSIGLFMAALPLIMYFLEQPVNPYSAVAVTALFPLIGPGLHLLSKKIFRWYLAMFAGLLLLYWASAAIRFDWLLWEYPRLIPENFFSSNQLNPFIFTAETILWMEALTLGLIIACFDSRICRRWLFSCLTAQGVIFLILFFGDAFWYSKPFPETLVLHQQSSIPGLLAIFSEHNSFAFFCLLHACLVAGMMFRSKGRIQIFAWLLFLIYSSLIFLSLSLNTVAAYVAVLVLIFGYASTMGFQRTLGWLFGKRRLLGFLTVLLMVLTALSVMYVYLDESPTFRKRLESIESVGPVQALYERRGFAWQVAVMMTRDFPVLGIGPGRFYLTFREYRDSLPYDSAGWFWQNHPHENAHNYYLQIAAEMGLLGLALFLALIYAVVRRTKWPDPFMAGAGFAVAATAIVSMMQHPLLIEGLFLTFASICGFTFTRADLEDLRNFILSTLRQRRSVFAFSSLLLGGLLILHLYSARGDMPPRFTYGVFSVEDDGAQQYRWTSRLALLRRDQAQEAELALKAFNPDLEENPLVVTLDRDSRLVEKIRLQRQEWHPLSLRLPSGAVLGISSSRVFQPPGEYRKLGVALSSEQIFSD